MSDPKSENSSYERVYRLLMTQTPMGKELMALSVGQMDAIQKLDFKWELEGTRARGRFSVSFRNAEYSFAEGQTSLGGIGYYTSPSSWANARDHFDPIVEKYLGKPRTGPNAVEGAIPTFNVKKEVVDGSKDRKGTHSFAFWAETFLDNYALDAKKRLTTRLDAIASAKVASPDYEEQRAMATQMLAVADMVEILKKWQFLPLDVLEDAWQKAVVLGVMGS